MIQTSAFLPASRSGSKLVSLIAPQPHSRYLHNCVHLQSSFSNLFAKRSTLLAHCFYSWHSSFMICANSFNCAVFFPRIIYAPTNAPTSGALFVYPNTCAYKVMWLGVVSTYQILYEINFVGFYFGANKIIYYSNY